MKVKSITSFSYHIFRFRGMFCSRIHKLGRLINAFADKMFSLKNNRDIVKQTLIHQSLVLSFEDILTFTLHFARFHKVVCFLKKLIMVLSSSPKKRKFDHS